MDRSTRQDVRTLVRTFYDMQKQRIMTGNRLCRNFLAQLGQGDGMPQDELTPEAKELLATLRAEYDLLAEALTRVQLSKWRDILGRHAGIIATPYEFAMAESYIQMERNEERLGREIAALIQEHPLWGGFLADVKGIGPILAAVIVAELDPHAAAYPSSFWAYAGLDVVVADGRGRSRRADHLVDRTYTDREGKEAVRKSITFNPFLKTKLVGVAGPCLLRAGGHYADVYHAYKHRLESREDVGIAAEAEKREGASKAHRHAMATRYMVKMLLLDLHREWRAIEGLPPTLPYHEGKLGHRHSA